MKASTKLRTSSEIEGRVFAWKDYPSWRRKTLRILADFIDTDVLNSVKQHPPRYIVEDDLSWLNDAIIETKGINSVDIQSVLLHRLSLHYDFVRAFHGCRPTSVKPYKRKGIIPCCPEELEKLAMQIFPDKARTEQAILKSREQKPYRLYREHNRGKVFFCLELDELVERCGQYLLYGSEYLECLASASGQTDVLRKRGRATVIECNVPISDIPTEFFGELPGEILREIFERYCDRSYRPGIIGFGFRIHRTLKPENIVRYHFPKGIPNPNNRMVRED